MACPAPSSAATGLLDYADAMRSIYTVNNEKSATAPNMAEIDKAGVESANCQNHSQAQAAAAAAWVSNKLPPNPTTAIANGSCFIDVMDIQIPVTGNGFLDSVMASLSPFLKSSACNKSANWWNDTKSKVMSGQFSGLGNQFSTVLDSAQATQTTFSMPAQGSNTVSSGPVSSASFGAPSAALSRQIDYLRQLLGL